jgi:thioredoxin-related protein
MQRQCRFAFAVLVILASSTVSAATDEAMKRVPMARNLALESRPAAKRQIPVLLVFTAPHCAYCKRVLEDYLIPMAKDPAARKRVVMRQIELGNEGTLIGFDGKETSHMEFASDQRVFLAPTVMFFDARGNALTRPIVGLLSPDFYGGYLEAGIEEATRLIRGK